MLERMQINGDQAPGRCYRYELSTDFDIRGGLHRLTDANSGATAGSSCDHLRIGANLILAVSSARRDHRLLRQRFSRHLNELALLSIEFTVDRPILAIPMSKTATSSNGS